ncbi:PucR family transcriptional regulator [Paenibacillus beijingensis]|uniref:PucR family transcriptional regulator n=1 Tax=Paenibacillus beijingensis TaxID=1126833 RepID=UPI0006991560|nr:PucR family transcriptional regulator [Paenibacillus beijingensis]
MRLDILLAHDIFKKHQVLTGESGLSRTVESVNIMDGPDIIHYLKPRELLLANGYFLKDRPEVLSELIEHMNRMDCPGLAIKTKRFSLSIPAAILERADRLHFPIIEISEISHSLGVILQQSTSLILDNKSYELQYALSIHKQFSSMIMAGGGISQIVESLAQLLSVPVLLLSHKLQLSDCSSLLKNKNMQPLMARVLSTLLTLPVLDAPVSLCFFHPEMGEYRHVDIHPIITSRHEGYLVFLQQEQTISNLYTLAIEQAANVISMETIKEQAVKERSRRYKNEFFSDLIDGFIASEQEALYLGRKYGLKHNALFLIITAKIDDSQTGSGTEAFIGRSDRDVHYDLLKRHFTAIPNTFTMFTKNDLFGLLLTLQDSDWEEEKFLTLLGNITSELSQKANLSISLGIGNPVTNVLDIGLSYREAVEALQTGYLTKKRGFIQLYNSNDISYLLRLISNDELEHFYEKTFQSFSSMDASEKSELMRTLRAYYDNQSQLVETAKQLYIHRNTVLYRLDKCERLMGVSLKDPMVSLRFRVAFAMEPFLKVKDQKNVRTNVSSNSN